MDDCDWLLSVEKACDWLRIEPGVTWKIFLDHPVGVNNSVNISVNNSVNISIPWQVHVLDDEAAAGPPHRHRLQHAARRPPRLGHHLGTGNCGRLSVILNTN